MKKYIFIRCDFSSSIGFGHLSRMIVLAKALELKKFTVKIFYKKTDISKINLNFFEKLVEIKSENDFLKSIIKNQPKSCIFDMHKIEEYELIFKIIKNQKFSTRLISYNYNEKIKDLCDLFVIPFPNLKNIPNNVLNGLRYQVFSEEIYNIQTLKKRLNSKIISCLITLGGADPKNITYKILQFFHLIGLKIKIYVIIGPFFSEKNIRMINWFAKKYKNIDIVYSPNGLASFYKKVNFVISSGGLTKFEVAYLKIPNFIIPSNKLEKELSLRFLKDSRLSYILKSNLNKFSFIKNFNFFLKKVYNRQNRIDISKNLFDGKEVSRVVEEIIK